MKIIFYNVHCIDFVWKPLYYYFIKRFAAKKHNYMINYIKNNYDNFVFWVDWDYSSFPSGLDRFIPKQLEFYLWAILNGLNIFKLNVVFKSRIDSAYKNWVIFTYSFLWLTKWFKEKYSNKFITLVHLNHYLSNTSILTELFKYLNIDFFVAENDLNKNSKYFNKFFDYYNKPVYFLPYSFQDRFVNKRKFNLRRNLAFSTGSFFSFTEKDKMWSLKDLYDFFKIDSLHPMRRELYNHKYDLKDCIDVYNENYYKSRPKTFKWNENLLYKIFYKIKNQFIKYSNYWTFNIVDKFNEYKMFICSEELVWLPWISFVEWMSCWSAYIWLDDNMYKNIWLIPWKHYIWYDWTLKNLIEKVRYYQGHEDELERIADNWYKFVRRNFCWENVAKNFFGDIKLLQNRYIECWLKKNNLEFLCSFTK